MSNKFQYKYSAPTTSEKEEIKSIRNRYLPKNETTSKLEELRKLDNKVHSIPLIFSLTFGIIGTLIFGIGLCFFLVWDTYWYIGILFGIIGIVVILINYYLYKKILDSLKNKYREKILFLSQEIINNNDLE